MNGKTEKKKTLTIINPNSNEKDLSKKNKMRRSVELNISNKNSNEDGASTKCDVSGSVSTQSSHRDIAKVLKALGGISKSLECKIPKEDSTKNLKGKKKNSKDFDAKQPTPAHSMQSRISASDSFPSALTQKMAEVLSCVTRKKPLSDLNLLKMGTNLVKNGNVSMPNFPYNGSTNTFSPMNLSTHENKRVATCLRCNKSSVGEKSRSSEYFKYFKLIKQPCQSSPSDNDQSLNGERQNSKPKDSHSISRNTSETFIRKINLTRSQDSSHLTSSPLPFKNSFESVDWEKLAFREPHSTKQLRYDTISVYSSYPRDSIQNRICPHRSQSGSAKLNLNTGTPSCSFSLLPRMSANNQFCCCDGKKQKRENLRRRSKHLLTSADPPGIDSKELSKTSVRVCHCPHLHTENAIKKICFHNCESPPNFYSSKIFRVNYLSRAERRMEKQISERIIKRDEEPVIEGSETAISEVLGKENSAKSAKEVFSSDLVSRSLNKSSLSFKTSEHDKDVSKNSLKVRKSLSNSKTEKKEKLKVIKTLPEYTRPKVVLWNKDNHVQILGQSNSKEKKRASEKKPSEGNRKRTVHSKPVKTSPQVKENIRGVVRPLSRLRSRDSKKVSNDDKTLEELAVLEKLFARLNTVERSLRKQKLTADSHQYRSISKAAMEKNKGEEESRLSFNQMKSLLVSDSPTEEECQRRRKKLRSAIIRHVKNWLKLDFEEV